MEQSELQVHMNELAQKIAMLPPGSIVKKTVTGREYYYHRWTENSGFHQQRHGTAQFIFHSGNIQHLCRGSLSYSLVWSGFTGCIELLITSKMV